MEYVPHKCSALALWLKARSRHAHPSMQELGFPRHDYSQDCHALKTLGPEYCRWTTGSSIFLLLYGLQTPGPFVLNSDQRVEEAPGLPCTPQNRTCYMPSCFLFHETTDWIDWETEKVQNHQLFIPNPRVSSNISYFLKSTQLVRMNSTLPRGCL
ncbi:hypothetical protein BXZ70DRAFT_507163 [Cristinia sonorae]|uniref:Uncharacterized protein n=1 Tax=Cristinia sonorae TaxID=1940300 RepID=A0A8K0UUW8_9AGAR|nr:hypothetical protein BXZ70DRAFT_507163 [Cristinia sonorae]